MKKILSLLLILMCVVVCLLTLPIEADAATEGYYTYEVSDGQATITDVDTTISGAITIPSTLGGYPVTGIGQSAFAYCTSLADITIPDGVTSIGMYSFSDCYSLTSITIPDSVTSIANGTFGKCTNLTSVTIPDSVTDIGSKAFYKCTNLTSVTIPNSVTYIGSEAFCFCTGLTSVTIPDSVTYIGSHVFFSCTSLESIVLPFVGNTAEHNPYHNEQYLFGYIFGQSFDPNSTATEQYYYDSLGYRNHITYYIPTSLKHVTVTSGKIIEGAFYNCSNLTSVTIGSDVSRVGGNAFVGCSSLNAVHISNLSAWCSISFGNEYANPLYYANDLYLNGSRVSNLVIPDGVTSIRGCAFYNCTSLTSITIPDSVTSIGWSAFSNCSRLTSVTYCGTEEQWNAINIGSGNTPLINAERIHHNYVDQGVITMPTFTTTGQQQKVCSVCGDAVTETLDMLVGEVSGWNVTLQDDLQVNFHLNISQSIENTARVRIVVGEEGYTFRVSGLEKTEDGLYIASVNIAAAQMTDFIFVTVINGSDLAETAAYTVRGYADTILADEDYSQYHQLVREMLHYGAAAQVYFDYEKDNLANEGITNTGAAEIPDSVDNALSVAGNAEGVTFYGASLIFQNKIGVRYYFRFVGDINDCSFVVNDTTYAPQLKDGLYYVEIADILPQDLDQQIALTVTDANGSTLTVAYSPMNYIVRMSEKGSAALQNLVKALYNYHIAAKALRT